MRKIQLKEVSFEKKMTILLPIFMSVLLLLGTTTVNRIRKVEAVEGQGGRQIGEQQALPIAEPLRIVCVLEEGENAFLTVLHIEPQGVIKTEPITDGDLMALYKRDGAAVLKESLQAEYYADITFEGLKQMLEYYGDGATVTLDGALQYTDDAGVTISFPAGQLHLSANQVLDLLRALSGEKDGAETVAALHAELFERYVDTKREAAHIYAAFVENADTDIRIYDFEKYSALLQALQTAATVE